MKKLVGGDYLLYLTPIEIEESVDGTTKTNITNKDVIAQLTNLKNYIRNPEMIKPVWVLFNNGETDEKIVARGQLSVVDTGEFEICVSVNGYKLRLFIEFTQAELSDHTPIDDWYIDTNDAKYLFTSDAQNVKATIEDEDFGDVELTGDLSVGGDASVTGDLSVTGKFNNESNPSVKPIYWHTIRFQRGGVAGAGDVSRIFGEVIILNNNSTPIDATAFMDLLKIDGFYAVVFNGKYAQTIGVTLENMTDILVGIKYGGLSNFNADIRNATTNELSTVSMGINNFVVTDLGVNKIN